MLHYYCLDTRSWIIYFVFLSRGQTELDLPVCLKLLLFSAFQDRFFSTFCKSRINFQELLNRIKVFTKYARKGQTKYVQLIAAVAAVEVVAVLPEVVVAILSVDQN